MKITKKEYKKPEMKTVWVETGSSILTGSLTGETEDVEDVPGNF